MADTKQTEWVPTRTYSPKRAQNFKGGVRIIWKPSQVKMTNTGPQVAVPLEYSDVKIGRDGKGYIPKCAEEDAVLFEETKKKDPSGICLFEDRQLPSELREAEREASKERNKRIEAETRLEEMQRQMKAAGFSFDPSGRPIPPAQNNNQKR